MLPLHPCWAIPCDPAAGPVFDVPTRPSVETNTC
jgi:hypothetical protein